MAAALSYRAQAPVIDGLMKELGLDGSSLDKLVSGGTGYQATTIDDRVDQQRKSNRIAKSKFDKVAVNEEDEKA